ncbi:ATP synthase F(0) complex subunit B1 [Mactra antiquata]
MLSTLVAKRAPWAGLKTSQCVTIVRCMGEVSRKDFDNFEATRPLAPNEEFVPSSAPIPQSLEQKVQHWKYANEVFFGPDRDLKNFPHPVYNTKPTETYQLGFIPTRWFKHLYPHTGVSGPYTLAIGTTIFLLSKEYLTMDQLTAKLLLGYFSFFYIFTQTKAGKTIKDKIDATAKEYDEKAYHEPLRNAKSAYLSEINDIKTEIERKDVIPAIFQAKQEQIDLQLEVLYRKRLREAFIDVKKRLDYEADMEAAKRQFEQDHMVNWIVSSVQKAITPQQEKQAIQSCIQTLKSLSATAAI